eukprot:SAG11_NODE_485_length_9035_cov_16.221352_5_plen_65_part_00
MDVTERRVIMPLRPLSQLRDLQRRTQVESDKVLQFDDAIDVRSLLKFSPCDVFSTLANAKCNAT